MKKQLLLGLMAIMACFAACKKENAKSPDAAPDKAGKLKTNVITYYYQDLVLQPRAPGVVYDTYTGYYGGVNIIVLGTPAWNTAEFPTPAVGMPLAGLSIGVPGGQNATLGVTLASQPTTASIYDNIFAVTVGALGGFNSQAFFADFGSYRIAVDQFDRNPTGSRPEVGNYVKENYSTSASLITTIGKLIWVSTGSHVAIAEVKYPYPKSAPVSTGQYIGTIADPSNPSVEYMLYGLNGTVTKMNVRGIPNSDKSETGTYTTTTNPYVNVVTATIVRPNGTSFTWSGTTYDLT
jgi:hypothetical protein